MPVFRTPEERFNSLPGFPFAPRYMEINGLRVHYIDEGKGDPLLCLHGEPTWSYLYRKMVPLLSAGHRIIAVDFIGFGRSDKFTLPEEYSFDLFFGMLRGFIDRLGLERITLIGHDGGALIGLKVACEQPGRFTRLVAMNSDLPIGEGPISIMFSNVQRLLEIEPDVPIGLIIKGGLAHGYTIADNVLAAYEAPFPDEPSKAGAATWPLLYPTRPDAPAAADMRRVRDALSLWQKPALVLSGEEDPIYVGMHDQLRSLIPSARHEPEIVIQGAGHFLLEEKGEEVARHILSFIRRTPG